MKVFREKMADQDSLLHKCMTYGIALILIAVCLALGGSGNVSPVCGWIVIVFLLYYAIVSKRILEALIFGALQGLCLYYGPMKIMTGFIDEIYANMETDDFVWMIIACGVAGVQIRLLSRAGGMEAFGRFIKKHARKKKTLNLWTWLMHLPLFFDDYMHIITLGGVMTPIYDEMDVPREDCAFIVQTTAEPLRVLFPINSWTPFMAGLFMLGGLVDNNTDALKAFILTIPFNFYCWVALIGSLLFALGLLPRYGHFRHPDKSVYKELSAQTEETGFNGKKGNLFDFFMPIVATVVLSYYFEWDLVPAQVIIIMFMCLYYMLRGIITTKDIEETLVEGFKDFVYIDILILFSYMLGGALENIGYIDYLVEVAKQVASPSLLPVCLFVIFCISEAAMSLNWNLLLIAFPVIIPVALGIGANPYLCAAAMISAGAFGNNFCYICDFSSITAAFTGLPTAYHAKNCMGYSLCFGAVSAVLFLIAGFVF